MEFKIDENLPVEAAELLRQAGYGAATVLDQNLGGRADSNVASACRRQGYALVTMEMDFADIRAYPPEQYSGIIVMRLKQQDKPHVLEILTRLMQVLLSEPLEQRLWVVEERRVRIRD